MIFTISTHDKFYFEQLIAFLTSAQLNSTKHKIHVCLIDYPEDLKEKLEKTYVNYTFENKSVERLDKRGISFILLRIQLLKEYFEKYRQPAAWIDTDVLIRRDLSDFLKINPNELKILYRGDQVPSKVKFNAGIFNLGYCNETLQLLSDWYNRLEKNAVWGMGQLELWNSYKLNKNKIRLVKMSDKFNDLGDSTNEESFNNDSVMWHSKKQHFYNEKFQTEFKKYLRIGMEIFNAKTL